MTDKWKEKAREIICSAEEYMAKGGNWWSARAERVLTRELRAAYQEGARDMRDRAVEATYKLSEARGYTTSGLFSDAIAALPLSPDDGGE